MEYKLFNDDCLNTLKTLEDNSVDSIVTDPPYGLSFMGKDWDRIGDTSANFTNLDKPHESQKGFPMNRSRGRPISETNGPAQQAWHYNWTKEALRVIKPGGYILAFGGTRTHHRLACALEDAGWEIRDCIMWVHSQGFPKSLDISKAIDKQAGAEREVVGKKSHAKKAFSDNLYAQDPANRNNTKIFGYGEEEITVPATDAAKQWEGWGTALKPAYEPIILARKPIEESTVAGNVLKYGTGGINIDGCRIETEETITNHSRGEESAKSKGKYGDSSKQGTHQTEGQTLGRFPANFIHDGSEEVLELFPNVKSGKDVNPTTNNVSGFFGNKGMYYSKDANYGDSGSAARFFYCAKASKKDRNEGCEDLENKKYQAGNYSQSPVCKTCDKTLNGINDHSSCSGEVYYKKTNPIIGNNHPTVKSTELMKYLCRLITPKGGIVLDPFMGSGSTGKAAMLEGFDFVGIEKEKEYFDIAEKRIKNSYDKESYTKSEEFDIFAK